MNDQSIHILIVEDDMDYAATTRTKLIHAKNHQFTVHISRYLSEAIECLKHERIDVILLDLSLPDSEGLGTLSRMHHEFPSIPLIVLTGTDDETLALDAMKHGADEYLIKGEDNVKMLERVISYALEHKRIAEILKKQKREHQVIFDSVPAMIWYKDIHNRCLRVNKAAADMLGRPVEDLEGKHLIEICPDYAHKYYEEDLDVIRTKKPKLGFIEQYTSVSGEKRWARVDKIPYQDEKGNVLGIIVCKMDVTERKQIEDSLRESERCLRKQSDVLIQIAKGQALESGDLSVVLKEVTKASAQTLSVERSGVWFYEANRGKLRCADMYELISDQHLSGMELETEKYPRYFESLEKSRFIAAPDAKTDIRTNEFSESYFDPEGITSTLDAPIRLRGKIIGVICNEHKGDPRQWTVEEQHFVASMADLVSLAMESFERKRAEDQVNHLAFYDSLTDLPNRVLFVDRLNQAMMNARRYQQLVAVLLLDLDHFKRIVDTLGHAIGDELIQAVAANLKRVLYETDTLTRHGGDEFTILLPSVEKMGDVIKVSEKIFSIFKSPFMVSGHELYVSASMGIAIFPNDGMDSVTLLKNADTAMYQAKEKGRNNYRLYSSAMSVKAFERLILENNLRRALEKNELLVYYQPQIDLKTKQVTCVEALVRWQHPTLGIVGPTEFIPIAEETGLIIPIGEWVMRESCNQIKRWRLEGYKPICVSVNLSDRQFEFADLYDVIEKILKDTGLEAQYLELELTESMIMKDLEETVLTLNRLKHLGVKLSIDDFGTGHSSLNYLKRFPIDALKIDRSFIHDIACDRDDATIARAIISMAHNLNLRVVAEGVETSAQLSFLNFNHCDLMQGYLFSKPVEAREITQYLIKEKNINEPAQSVA